MTEDSNSKEQLGFGTSKEDLKPKPRRRKTKAEPKKEEVMVEETIKEEVVVEEPKKEEPKVEAVAPKPWKPLVRPVKRRMR